MSYLCFQRKLNPKIPSNSKSCKIILYLTEESAIKVEMDFLKKLQNLKGNIQLSSSFPNKRHSHAS